MRPARRVGRAESWRLSWRIIPYNELMIRDSVDKSTLPVLNDENAFKLGIFGFNMRGGITMADLPEMVQGTWDESVRYAQWADRLDLDACVPIARWRGYGGEKNLGDRSF